MDRLMLVGENNYREIVRITRMLDDFHRSVRELRDSAEIGNERRAELEALVHKPRTSRVLQTYANWHTVHRNRLIKQPPGRFAFYQGEF